jgi:hypothetical protein
MAPPSEVKGTVWWRWLGGGGGGGGGGPGESGSWVPEGQSTCTSMYRASEGFLRGSRSSL